MSDRRNGAKAPMNEDDVLSSIRRLITNGTADDQPPLFAAPVRDRLYLTPELRIDDGAASIAVEEVPELLNDNIAFLDGASANRPGVEAGNKTETTDDLPQPALTLKAADIVEEPEEPEPQSATVPDPAPKGAAEPAAQDQAAEVADDDDADEDVDIIDEDGLRALIAEVVAEELRGALGQEMTQNLRRLVSAEVRRAIANHATKEKG